MSRRVSENGRRLGHIIGWVYLLHFARAFHGKQHYLGFSTDPEARLARHLDGRGNPLVYEASRHGAVKIVRLWHPVDGFFEAALKREHHLADLCPVCRKRSGAA